MELQGKKVLVFGSGKSGIDFCILDMEHGPVSYEHLPNLIRACECTDTLPIVRVADNCEEYISKACGTYFL